MKQPDVVHTLHTNLKKTTYHDHKFNNTKKDYKTETTEQHCDFVEGKGKVNINIYMLRSLIQKIFV